MKILSIPILITVVAVEWTFMQRLLHTTSLTGGQWAACMALALVVPITIELSKIPHRRHLPTQPPVDPAHAVNPARGLASPARPPSLNRTGR